jgi:hypothetical protein
VEGMMLKARFTKESNDIASQLRIEIQNRFCNSYEHHRQQLEKVGREFGVRALDDWYKVPRSLLYKKCQFINKYYSDLFTALKELYPHHSWSKSAFMVAPRNYWSDLSNQRTRLEQVATELNIKELDEWSSVSNKRQIYQKCPFIAKQYGDLFTTLKTLYPNHVWKESDFKGSYWDNVENQRKRLEEVALELGVKELDDWYKVNRRYVHKRASFIYSCYGDTYRALKALYPQHNWNMLRFEKLPRGSWNKDTSLFRDALTEQMKKYNITEYSQWYRLPVSDVKLFHKIANNSKLLQKVFPNMQWKIHNCSSKPETILQDMLSAITRIETQTTVNGHSVDVYIPDWKLAIEYQGKQHYQPHYRGDLHELILVLTLLLLIVT